jgi:hypothetical protein
MTLTLYWETVPPVVETRLDLTAESMAEPHRLRFNSRGASRCSG